MSSAACALSCHFIRNFSHCDLGTDSIPASVVLVYLRLLMYCMSCWFVKAIRRRHVGRYTLTTQWHVLILLQPSADMVPCLLLRLGKKHSKHRVGRGNAVGQ